MQRRDFCKLAAATAAANAIAGFSQTAVGPIPAGFNKYTLDYAQFKKRFGGTFSY